MTHLKVIITATLAALIASVHGEDAEPSPGEEELLKNLLVLQDPQKVNTRSYITCDGVTWSCEDCLTRRLCLEFWWYTGVTYYQCPTWAPYCNSSSTFAWCTTSSTPGCTGNSTG